jgi:ribosome-associated translation inhibitor RaiA
MTEAGWLSIVNLIITSGVGVFMWYVKYTASNERKEIHQEAQVQAVQVKESAKDAKASVDNLERQINSNLEKYVERAVSEALAKERLAVLTTRTQGEKP